MQVADSILVNGVEVELTVEQRRRINTIVAQLKAAMPAVKASGDPRAWHTMNLNLCNVYCDLPDPIVRP